MGALWEKKVIERVLVIAPTSVVAVWPKELDEYAAFPVTCRTLLGDKRQRLKAIGDLERYRFNKCRVAVINYESTWREGIFEALEKYDADMIGLLWGEDGMPRDVDERCMHMVDLVLKAQESGVSEDRIWIDPIATPISGDINQVLACLDFMDMLPEINPNCKSIVGLSNVSNGTPRALRPYLNRTYLAMLKRKGLYSAIVDATDYTLIDIARDRAPEITEVIYNAMDGDDSIPADPELANYAKTVQVLLGKKLYSHMWLD